MRIAFTLIGNSRRSNFLTGDTIRSGGAGASGTDTSTILVAEHLATVGHEVVVTSDPLEPPLMARYTSEGKALVYGTKIRGVIVVNSLWFQDYEKLPIKVTKALIYWCHMQWIYGIDHMMSYCRTNNLKLAFVNISNWERSMNQGVIDHVAREFSGTIQTLIPNPILDDEINKVLELNLPKKPHKVVFHASWARGGNVAMQAVREMNWPDAEFHAFDYLMTIHQHPEAYFCNHNGVDKQTLFRHIAEAEYFIYPLYTPYQDVHKDTFSCVVAEAIALGAIPVTYPLGALRENFNGYCAWLDFPPDTNRLQMQSEPLSKDLTGKFTCTDNIVRKIQELESDPTLKADLRRYGKNTMISNFNVVKVGTQWEALINSL
jgi:hypothetical protein